MDFKIRWLDSEEFNRLPYKKAPTALGLADKTTGTVYVRDTGNVALDTFSVYHELEHLKGNDHGEHEDPDEKGVYYKDAGGWMQTAAPFANFIPGIGPAVSLGLGAGGTAMSMRNQSRQATKASQMGSQMGQQGGAMSGFGQAPQAPNVVQAGGGSQDGMAGGVEQGTIAKIRELLSSRSKGFYSGRDAGGM